MLVLGSLVGSEVDCEIWGAESLTKTSFLPSVPWVFELTEQGNSKPRVLKPEQKSRPHSSNQLLPPWYLCCHHHSQLNSVLVSAGGSHQELFSDVPQSSGWLFFPLPCLLGKNSQLELLRAAECSLPHPSGAERNVWVGDGRKGAAATIFTVREGGAERAQHLRVARAAKPISSPCNPEAELRRCVSWAGSLWAGAQGRELLSQLLPGFCLWCPVPPQGGSVERLRQWQCPRLFKRSGVNQLWVPPHSGQLWPLAKGAI